MSSLTVCTLKPYNCETVEVVWRKSTGRYHVVDVNGIEVRKQGGYSDVGAAMRAAAKFATDEYTQHMNRPL